MSKTDRIIKMAIICIENEMLNLKNLEKTLLALNLMNLHQKQIFI